MNLRLVVGGSPATRNFGAEVHAPSLTPARGSDYDPLVPCLRSQFADCCQHPTPAGGMSAFGGG